MQPILEVVWAKKVSEAEWTKMMKIHKRYFLRMVLKALPEASLCKIRNGEPEADAGSAEVFQVGFLRFAWHICYRLFFLFNPMKVIPLLTLLLLSLSSFGQPPVPRFDVQGHRGARGLKPENTIPAFITALDSGATTLELDVVITKDSQIVVSHEPWMAAGICLDPEGNAITKKQETKFNIYQMLYEEVKKFDCGSKGNEHFPMQDKLKTSKPLLTDVINAVEDHIKSYTRYEVDYNIEIKSDADGDGKFHPAPEEFSNRVFDLVNQYLPMERVVIQSFDFRVLKYWHEKYPHVRLAALVENLKSIDENIRTLGFRPSVYSPEYKLLSKGEVRRIHDLGMRVIPWTVNDVKEMEELKQWGVDGVITDYPNRARPLVQAAKP